MKSERSYRASHTEKDYGRRYNQHYEAGYYAGLFREIELPILKDLWTELGGTELSLLDFACGTGRITREAAPYFRRVVGVDISPEMLKFARGDRVDYRLRDVIAEPLDERFDVVTAFRFFLNSEVELRLQALKAIANHLAANGRLICNIHMNATSPMGLIYRLLSHTPWRTHNTLSLNAFTVLLSRTGFVVDRVIWYGMLPRPGHYFARLTDRIVGPFERALVRVGLRGPAAQSYIIIARLSVDREAA